MAISNHPNPTPSAMFLSCLKFLRGCPWFLRLKTPQLLTVLVPPACSGPSLPLWPHDGVVFQSHGLDACCNLHRNHPLQHVHTHVFPSGLLPTLPILAQASLAHLAPVHSWFLGTPTTTCQCLSWGCLHLSLSHPPDCQLHGSQEHLPHAPRVAAHSSVQSVCAEETETLGVVQWWCEVHRSVRSRQEVSSFSSSSCW